MHILNGGKNSQITTLPLLGPAVPNPLVFFFDIDWLVLGLEAYPEGILRPFIGKVTQIWSDLTPWEGVLSDCLCV